MKTKELTINGMSCGHCVTSVKNGLSGIEGLEVESVEIGKAVIQYDEARVPMDAIKKAVEEAGYSLGA